MRGVVAKPATAGNKVSEDAEGYRATEGTTRTKRGERPKDGVLGDIKARVAFAYGPLGEEVEFFEVKG